MNERATARSEPLALPLARHASTIRFPFTIALHVIVAVSVALMASALISQSGILRQSGILALPSNRSTTSAVVPTVQSGAAVPRALPQTSGTKRTQTADGIGLGATLARGSALSESSLARPLRTAPDAEATRQAVRDIGSALYAPAIQSVPVERPPVATAGSMPWQSNVAPALCSRPACQFPMVRMSSPESSQSFVKLGPTSVDPWGVSFLSRLANQHSEVMDVLILPSLGLWGQPLEFGAMRFSASPYHVQLSMTTRSGLYLAAVNPLWTPLNWFGVEQSWGFTMRTPGGLEVIGAPNGIQILQHVATPLGPIFGGITSLGPIVGGQFTSGSVSAHIATLVTDGQVKVAGTITLQQGNFSLGYAETAGWKGVLARFARAPLDLSVVFGSSGAQLTLSYTPTGGTTVLASWSNSTGLHLLVLGSLSFERRSPVSLPEPAAPSTSGAVSNH